MMRPSALLGKVARRLRWEAYSARTVARRSVLDVVCSPKRQARRVRSAGLGILLAAAPAAIEPDYGYVVSGQMAVLDDSLMYSEDARVRSQRPYFSGVPTIHHLVRHRPTLTFDGLATVRCPYDSNYYHAVIDCLGSIALMADDGTLDGRTVIVGPGLASTAVFQHAAQHGRLRDITWRVQHDEWVATRSDIAFVRPDITGNGLRRTAAFLAGELETVPSPDVKLYVTRSAAVGRGARNDTELAAELATRGFQSVDPGALSWPEQVALFRSASEVVGIHGAALTNIIFRAGPLRLIELHPSAHAETNFRDIAVALDMPYTPVMGHGGGRSHWSDFDVDIAAVLAAVDERV